VKEKCIDVNEVGLIRMTSHKKLFTRMKSSLKRPREKASWEQDSGSDDDSAASINERENEEELLRQSQARRNAILAKYATAQTSVETKEHIERSSETAPPAQIEQQAPASMEFLSKPIQTSSTKPVPSMFDESIEEIGQVDEEDRLALDTSKVDSFDDTEGYYKIQTGEVLLSKFLVTAIKGRGVFSSVIQAKVLGKFKQSSHSPPKPSDDILTVLSYLKSDGIISPPVLSTPAFSSSNIPTLSSHSDFTQISLQSEVAIKLIRSNDLMRKGSQKEIELLKLISSSDPEGKYHVVKLLATFEHLSHPALVFESMWMNLKEVQVKFGRSAGISLKALRSYSLQLLLSLALLESLHIIHADIKPHNVLVNESYQLVKLSDFGSAFRVNDQDNVPAPYLVSRFYRAPEISLGLKPTCAIDVWSLGCVLFELYVGHPLFAGKDTNDMLYRIQQVCGIASHKMIKAHFLACKQFGFVAHFNDSFMFARNELDPVMKTPVVKYLASIPPSKSIREMIFEKRSKEDDVSKIHSLIDLLEKMLQLDPNKRISVKDALSHEFFKI
jgi:serine/threonine-protein kinase PRP4